VAVVSPASLRAGPALSVVSGADLDWAAFVAAHPQATMFHHAAWSSVLAQAYGFRPLALVQRDPNGQISAGLPVVELGADGDVVGLPFTDYCAPLVRGDSTLTSFSEGLVGWSAKQRGREITVHGELEPVSGIHFLPRGVRHVLPLRPDGTEVMAALKGGSVPRAIRKAQREGLAVRFNQSEADFDIFYRLHLDTRRRLGVPVQPIRFLRGIWQRIVAAGLGFVVFVEVNARPVAAALFLAWNGTLIYKFGASDPRYWQLRPNNLVMWAAIERGCREGFAWFDFGRSDLNNRGLREFKSRWGATEVPLVYSHVAPAPPAPAPRLATWALARVIQLSPPIVCRAIGEILYGRAARLTP
jgi:CelD/BcsL family acetyltransferase involved in cellulose biosynthesis